MSQAIPSEKVTPFEDGSEHVQQFKNVAETGLRSLKEFAANPEGFFSSEKGQQLKGLAENSFGDAKDKLEVWIKDGEDYARENPGKALLAAVGVGFVLGVLLKR